MRKKCNRRCFILCSICDLRIYVGVHVYVFGFTVSFVDFDTNIYVIDEPPAT